MLYPLSAAVAAAATALHFDVVEMLQFPSEQQDQRQREYERDRDCSLSCCQRLRLEWRGRQCCYSAAAG